MNNHRSGGAVLEPPPVPRETVPPPEPRVEGEKKPPPREASRPRFRRRKYFVNPRVQGPLLLHALGYAFFFMLVMAFGIFSPLVNQLDGMPLSRQNPFWNPAYSFLYLHYRFWPLAFLAVLAIALHSVFSSHRMAGPLYRLSMLFRRMKEGSMPARQVIRKRDFLHPEFEEFNAMVSAWKERIGALKEEAKNLERLSGLLQEEALLSDSQSLLDLVQSITETKTRLSAELDWFREEG